MLELQASAETVTVPDGTGTWTMRIEARGEKATEGSSVVLTAYEEPAAGEAVVPEPVDLAPLAPAAAAVEAAPETLQDPGVLPAVTPAPAVDPAAYWCVYRSIPFIRTEYLANPAYRHEATMEFLFGQLRPTVIHKTQAVAPPVVPAVRSAPPVPPYVYDVFLGQIPTFVQRYRPPTIPFGYPLTY